MGLQVLGEARLVEALAAARHRHRVQQHLPRRTPARADHAPAAGRLKRATGVEAEYG